MVRNYLLLSAATSLALSGCVSAPTKSLFGPQGTVTRWTPPADASPAVVSLRLLFERDVREAYAARDNWVDRGTTKNENNLDADRKIQKMMRSGYTLIYANCSTFFRGAARNQRRMGVVRDLIAPVTAVLTGILALHDFKDHPGQKEDLLSVITLGSTAASAGLNIYDERFLFASENVDSVRELTLNALWADRNGNAVRNQQAAFEDALIALFDNEAVCSPAHILLMAREAIKKGKPQPTSEDKPEPAPTPARSPSPSPTSPPSLPLSGGRTTLEIR